MMGREQFKAMKKMVIFINVARGALVDHEALVDAVRDGEIAHAGLDITDPEPLPRDHPLLKMNNVTVLLMLGVPHMPQGRRCWKLLLLTL